MSQSEPQLDKVKVVELIRGLTMSHRQNSLQMLDIVENLQEIHKSMMRINEEEAKQIQLLEGLLKEIRMVEEDG